MSTDTVTIATAPRSRRRPSIRGALRRPAGVVSFLVLLVIVVACFGAPLWAPYDPLANDLANSLSGPSPAHWLGTDQLGRDVLSRLLHGGQPVLIAALIVMLAALVIGVPLALLAGYRGGRLDAVVMRGVDLGLALPSMVIVLLVLAVFGDQPMVGYVALGLLLVPALVRILRANTIAVRHELFIDAAKVAGVSPGSIVVRHIFPRILGSVLVQASLLASVALLFITGLGYLGFTTTAPDPSWGTMINEASQVMRQNPAMLAAVGGMLGISVLCLGILGDVISDATIERWTKPRSSSVASARQNEPIAAATTAADREATLSLRNLTVTYRTPDGDQTVVDDVSFDIRTGEVLGLVGESGCGKTTTARAVLGLLRGGRVTGGAIMFEGRDLTTLKPQKLRELRGTGFAYISQEPMIALDPTVRVGTTLAKAVRLHTGMSSNEARARVLELLAQVRFVDPERVANLYPHEISGGMAQRVSIARALAGEPRLLIADEPTTALDVTVQAEVLDLLRQLRDERGLSILIVTHDWGVVADLCDRAVVMYEGRIVEQAQVGPLFHDPQHPYTRGLLASNPSLAPDDATHLPTLTEALPMLAADAPDLVTRAMPTRSSAQTARRSDHAHDHQEKGSRAAPLLEVQDLCVSYGHGRSTKEVVHNVSFTIDEGSAIGLVGESGSGKSTIGRAIAGLVAPSSGSILLDGEDIGALTGSARRPLASQLQVVFQDPYSSLNPAVRVRDVLLEPLRVLGWKRANAERRVIEMIDKVGISPNALDRYAGSFSGGQRQRLAIARALVSSPRLVICDEATSALDLSIQAQVLNLLRDLQLEMGLSYLFIGHNLEVVRFITPKFVVLHDGRVVESGPSREVMRNPQDPYTRRLVSSVLSPNPDEQAKRRQRRIAADAQ